MPAVGAYLRELRERQGVSLDEISRSTRVLQRHLEALESDNLASLPAPVFARGFIRAYCQALGIAPDEALTMYDQKVGQSRTPTSLVPPPRVARPPRPAPQPRPVAAVAAPKPVPVAKPVQPPAAPAHRAAAPAHAPALEDVPDLKHIPTPAAEPAVAVERAVGERTGERSTAERRENRSRGTVLISFVLLVILGAALFAVTVALQSGRDHVDAGAAVHVAAPAAPSAIQASASDPAPSEPEPPQRPVVASQPPKPQPAPQLSPATASTLRTPTAAPPSSTPSQAAGAIVAPYRLVARTSEMTWMRVRTEDGRTSEETIPANEVREWVSNGPFVVTIGNAGGVSLELNGRPVPRLGASGAVISRMVLPPDVQ